MDAFNQSRRRVWKPQQPAEFFAEAILDADGTIVPSDSEGKQGMDFFAYIGQYGYHPLLISLANTAEPLFLFNRSGNRPSQELADVYLDKAGHRFAAAGLPQDPDAGATPSSPRPSIWIGGTERRPTSVSFSAAYESHTSLEARADELPANAYSLLKRPQQHQIKTTPREKPERVKQEIVRERGYETVHLLEEMIAEFEYQPVACKKSYRMIVLRKLVAVDKGQMRLFEEYRYFFYITNDRQDDGQTGCGSRRDDRCDQENQIASAQKRWLAR